MTEELKTNVANSVTKIKQIHENAPFKDLIMPEVESERFQKFLADRIKEKDEYRMNMKVTDYFSNFNKYEGKVQNVILFETHEALNAVKQAGFFVNPNLNLHLILNNTFSTDSNQKVKSHYDYWRIFAGEAIAYLDTLFKKQKVRFFFVGSDVCYDFMELVGEDHEKILLPEHTSVSWTDGSLKQYPFML